MPQFGTLAVGQFVSDFTFDGTSPQGTSFSTGTDLPIQESGTLGEKHLIVNDKGPTFTLDGGTETPALGHQVSVSLTGTVKSVPGSLGVQLIQDGDPIPVASAYTQPASAQLPATVSLTYMTAVPAGGRSLLQVRLITDAGNPVADLTGLSVTITAVGSRFT
ncbi:hypothetical protein ABTZ03_44105 [Kitasatospora sp. NPDC096077]|uniref:hypothetical protein n=1 Tax=Kitasatospora sp. NPDC096077 TaxID=3155544 RepID=UPI003328BB30